MKSDAMWNPDHSLEEADAELAAKNNTLKSLKIVKENEDFYVLAHLTWRKEELFLATTRQKKEPRRFKHLGRLIEHIEKHYPVIQTISFEFKR